ncbi:hypothetical protein DFH09DRAFT_1416318 [Mycena vulgaris]|nr:hypothetical protein DFH09DRAFT_1416318 [Mycena vulgaris]
MPTPALSAHASRSPTKDVQPTRQRRKLTDADKATRALMTATRAKLDSELEEGYKEIFARREDDIEQLAIEFKRPESQIRVVLENSVHYTKKCRPNLKNVICYELSREARENGEESNLLKVDLSGAAYKAYKDSLSEERKEELIQQLVDAREVKEHGIRATNKAAAMDCMQTSHQAGRVVHLGLNSRIDCLGFAMFSRGNNQDVAVPYWVDSDNANLFFPEVLEITMYDMVCKFEAWSCNRKKKKASNNLGEIRRQISETIEEGLVKITNDKTLKMSWTRYNVDIIHECGVELAGWPTDNKGKPMPMVRPSKLPAERACLVLGKLKSGAIHWVVLTKDFEDGKERSDANHKRGPRAGKEAADDSSESEEEDKDSSEDEEDGEEDEPEPTRCRTASTTSTTTAHTPATATAAPTPATFMATPTPATSVMPVVHAAGPTTASTRPTVHADAFGASSMGAESPVQATLPRAATQLLYDPDFWQRDFDFAEMDLGIGMMPQLPDGWGLDTHADDDEMDSWRLNGTNRGDDSDTVPVQIGSGVVRWEDLQRIDANVDMGIGGGYGLPALVPDVYAPPSFNTDMYAPNSSPPNGFGPTSFIPNDVVPGPFAPSPLVSDGFAPTSLITHAPTSLVTHAPISSTPQTTTSVPRQPRGSARHGGVHTASGTNKRKRAAGGSACAGKEKDGGDGEQPKRKKKKSCSAPQA